MLTTLDLYSGKHVFSNNITEAGIRDVSQMTRLRSLALPCKNISDEGIKCLSTSLTELQLFDGKIVTDACLQHIANMPLRTLVLSNMTGLTGAGLRALSNMPLRTLVFSNIGGVGSSDLHSLPPLETLKLFWIDSDMQFLQKQTQLRELALFTNHITNIGFLPLSLEQFTFKGDEVTDAGLSCLQQLTNLRKLHLTSRKITNIEFLPASLEEFSLVCTEVTDAGLSRLQQLLGLHSLHLTCKNLTEDNMKYLKRLTLVERLSLHSEDITDQGMQYLLGFQKLHVFSLLNAKITNDGVSVLQRLPLSSLWFSSCALLTDEAFANLPKTLTSLTLFNMKISDQGMGNLRAYSLRELDLVSCPNITDTSLPIFNGLKLQELTLLSTGITNERYKVWRPETNIPTINFQEISFET